MLRAADRAIRRNRFLDQVRAERERGDVHVVARRMIRIGDRHAEQLFECRNHAQVDARQARRISGRALMDHDAIVAGPYAFVERYFDFADCGITGVELYHQSRCRGSTNERDVIHIRRRDL